MTQAADAPVRLTIADTVAEISFNRPKVLNAFNLAASKLFLACCERLAADSSARVVVLRGEGSSFMAGGDLAQFRDAKDRPEFTKEILEPLNGALLILDERRSR